MAVLYKANHQQNKIICRYIEGITRSAVDSANCRTQSQPEPI